MPEEKYMRRAIKLAKKGSGHVNPNPLVGAVIVRDGEIIGEGYHECYGQLHAERNAIANAKKRGNSLEGSTIYVTLEPCTMCAGALVSSRITKVLFGAADLKAGAFGSLYNIATDPRLSHHPEVVHGVMATECASILSDLFKNLRDSKTN